MNDLQIRFEGDQAEKTATEFSRIYRDLFGETPRAAIQKPQPKPTETERSVELALAVISVVLALPSGLKDYADLVERLKLGDKLRRLAEFLDEERRQRGTSARLVVRDGRVYDFDRLEPEELMELFSDNPKS